MINETTNNKNYPLPHPNNVASQDVERIATAIEMIDEDISECSDSINTIDNAVRNMDAKALKIPTELVGEVDTELTNIHPGRYIVVNKDANGFSTVEGGGGEGGKKGEVLVKRSDANFDTTWIDPRTILKQSPITDEASTDKQLPNNGLMILRDSIEQNSNEQLPSRGITSIQSTDNVIADSFCGYILKDEIESENEEDDIASTTKFGRVKIGSGINVTNGVISVPKIGIASKNNFGLVKIGDGLEVADGVVSTKPYPQADHANYGTIKLSDDFKVGDDGELLLANKNENEGVIYQTANIKPCFNNTIAVEETYSVYRLWINEDCMINFDWSLLDQKKDATFDVKLYASDTYVVAFSDEIIWNAPCAGVVSGKTVLRFTKRLNLSTLEGNLIEQDKNAEKLLSLYPGDDIAKNYTCHTTGSDGWPAYEFLRNTRSDIYWEYSWPVVPDEEGAIFQINFMKSTYVTKVDFGCSRGSSTTFFYIEASLDGVNWIKQYQRLNQSVNGEFTFTLENRGYFRHYRIRCANNVCFSRIRFWGYDIEDRLFELRRITPRMFSNSQGGYILTSHVAVNDGALNNITDVGVGTFASFSSRDENGYWWIKYELPEAKVVDFIDIASGNGDTSLNPSWFEIEGSNDDEHWTLLIERRQPKTWNKCQAFQYFIDNTVAYKYYKLTIKNTANATSCRIYRWRLYKKEDGIRGIENLIPKMLAASQDGYVVTAESQYDNSHAALYAFDGNSNTRWASGGSAPSWIQIQFPTAVACNAYQITSRNDGYYNQAPREFRLEGSNDGTTWRTLDTQTGIVFNQNETKLFDFINDRAYLYYRIYVTASNGGDYVAISKFELGRLFKTYKKDINVYEYLIPPMSSNSQDGYVASADSTYGSNYPAWKAFDRSNSSSWTSRDATSTTPHWLKIYNDDGISANTINIQWHSEHYGIDYVISGSDDDETYTDLVAITDNNSLNPSYYLSNIQTFKYWKIYITRINTNQTRTEIHQFNLIKQTIIQEY